MTSREARLRHRLVEAVYLDRFDEAERHAEQLRRHLSERADGDTDLEIVGHWLDERVEQHATRRARKLEAARRLEAFLAFTLKVDRDRFSP